MNCCCENCGWSEIVGSPIICHYTGNRTWRDECCEAWKPKEEETNMVEVVRCKDCKHRPKEPNFETYESGFDLEFPEGSKCPCRCYGDEWYSWYPDDEWFCADGEHK